MDTPKPNSAEELAQLRRSVDEVNERLKRLEDMLQGLSGVIDTAPAVIATATDSIDYVIREAQDRGLDLEARAQDSLRVVEKLTEPKTLRTLERALEHADKLDVVVDQLDALPGAFATVVNIFDEAMRYATEQGVDFDRMVRVMVGASTHIITFAQSKEFESLLTSDLLDPKALGVVQKATTALKQTQQETGGRSGLMGMWRAMRDPDVQRALDFGVRFGRRFGSMLGQPNLPGSSNRQITE